MCVCVGGGGLQSPVDNYTKYSNKLNPANAGKENAMLTQQDIYQLEEIISDNSRLDSTYLYYEGEVTWSCCEDKLVFTKCTKWYAEDSYEFEEIEFEEFDLEELQKYL